MNVIEVEMMIGFMGYVLSCLSFVRSVGVKLAQVRENLVRFFGLLGIYIEL